MWNKNKTSVSSNNMGNWKSFRKYVNNMPGKHDIKEIQCHAGHCTHISTSTNVKVQTFNMGNNFTSTVNCNYR